MSTSLARIALVRAESPDLSLATALADIVLQSDFLGRLHSEELRTLAIRGSRRRLAVGRILNDVASASAPFRIVLAGRVVLEPVPEEGRGSGLIEVVEAGGVMGETGLVQDWGLGLRGRIVEAADILEIDAAVVRTMLARDATLWTQLAALAGARAVRESLASSRLLPELHPETREALVAEAQIVGFAPGQTVLKQGVHSKSLYVVLSGQLRASVHGRDAGRRDAGDLLGEMSIYGDGELFGVSAISLVRALKVSRRFFGELISTHPMVLERLSHLVDERRRHAAGFAAPAQEPEAPRKQS